LQILPETYGTPGNKISLWRSGVAMAENVRVSKAVTARKKVTKFFKEIRVELKKVIWPTRKQLVNYTITVLLTCLIVGTVIWVVDFGLAKIVGIMLTK
jgi:preprotein translocase subunit SecE